MESKIKKFLAYNGKVSVICSDTTKLVQQAVKIHDLTPTTTAVLGRVLTIAAMMTHVDLKEETDSITIQIKGEGPVGNIVAITNLENSKKAILKAYLTNPHIELELKENGKIDVGGAVGKTGFLNVIEENNLTNSNYNGIIPLVSGEIAEDFTEFFAKSKQKPTAICLGVLVNSSGVKKAGGYMINPMPDATEDEIKKVEQAISNSESISNMLNSNLTLEQIAKKITGDENIILIDDNLDAEYKCDCNKSKFKRGIISLGKDELKKILEEDQKIETQCHFCHNKYNFSQIELQDIIKQM